VAAPADGWPAAALERDDTEGGRLARQQPMSATKRPSTSSLRRYLTSRPYISVADIRRRFGLEADAMSHIGRNGTSAYIGLPEREASKLQDLWQRDEVGLELSVEVHAPVVVGIYPMRIARFVLDQATVLNGHAGSNGVHPTPEPVADPSEPIVDDAG
jgi:hypothetical protein